MGVRNQMDSRTVGSLLFSGHIGKNTGMTENRETHFPVNLSPREVAEIAKMRRRKGMFTEYMNASIKKNVNVKAIGHC